MEEVNPYIRLAKSAVEIYIKEGRIISSSGKLPERILKERSGVFVTIKKDSKLRGCIGTYLPTKQNIAHEIISNAVSAATEDYRFPPIQEQELPSLSYTVYLLDKPEMVSDIKKLNPKKYGLLVRNRPEGNNFPKAGLLLPGLEGINKAEKQITVACRKAGIDPQKEKITLFRFTVEKHS